MKNEIARRAFASLVLDAKYPGDEYFPPSVSCRILMDGDWIGQLYAASEEEAVKKFMAGEFVREDRQWKFKEKESE